MVGQVNYETRVFSFIVSIRGVKDHEKLPGNKLGSPYYGHKEYLNTPQVCEAVL